MYRDIFNFCNLFFLEGILAEIIQKTEPASGKVRR